jgi:hypothetical protein
MQTCKYSQDLELLFQANAGDGLQVFWDYKLYEDQRATVVDTLSENSKKEYPKSVTKLLRLEGK